MKFRNILSSALFIKSTLVVAVFLLLFISSVSYRHGQSLTESTGLLVHSYNIQLKLEQLLSLVKDAETGQRGFIISKDTVFLQPYNNAKEDVEKPISELRVLTSNDIMQNSTLDSITRLIDHRFSLLSSSLQMFAENNDESRHALSDNLMKGKKVMDQIRSHMNKMISSEIRNFEDHERKYAREVFFTPLSTLYLMLFSLTVFVLAYLKISKDVTTLKRTNANLQLTNEAFRHAEEIGSFSSWQWHVDENRFIFSENQYGLLGLEPAAFEPTMENFLKYVHPDDRHVIIRAADAATDKRKPSGAFFRIIRKDGEIRYIKSVARLTDFHNKLVFIGINSDITEQHLSSIALEDRNKELEKSNSELASFNHIASHDLQEPLRKIQTFISRLNEKEADKLSVSGKEYLEKIQFSVKKMRSLIGDLLLFSRANRSEKIFRKSDLNELLASAIHELSSDFEEKNANITSEVLPVAKVIDFQIQQLFQNLIGNSIKYSKPGITPDIKITCQEVKASDYLLLAGSEKKYFKFSVSDNGIGFEQKYAGNLFDIFYRLNPGADYPGSGIGLSICKKIIDNHGGFIYAEGKPGAGATFTFFLPV
jgi:signal transduction histidine kinase/CHASE3 domain sensor protein